MTVSRVAQLDEAEAVATWSLTMPVALGSDRVHTLDTERTADQLSSSTGNGWLAKNDSA